MGTSVAVSQATAIFEIRLLELANRLDCVAGEAPVSIHLWFTSACHHTGSVFCVGSGDCTRVLLRRQSVRVSH